MIPKVLGRGLWGLQTQAGHQQLQTGAVLKHLEGAATSWWLQTRRPRGQAEQVQV